MSGDDDNSPLSKLKGLASIGAKMAQAKNLSELKRGVSDLKRIVNAADAPPAEVSREELAPLTSPEGETPETLEFLKQVGEKFNPYLFGDNCDVEITANLQRNVFEFIYRMGEACWIINFDIRHKPPHLTIELFKGDNLVMPKSRLYGMNSEPVIKAIKKALDPKKPAA